MPISIPTLKLWTDAQCPVLRPWVPSAEVRGELEHNNTLKLKIQGFANGLQKK